MKKTFTFCLIIIFISCSKENAQVPESESARTQVYTAATIYNPIVGVWELGTFNIICFGDTITSGGTPGDFVDFSKRDTAFYTYNTLGTTGYSPYSVIDSATIMMGDTMHIIRFNSDSIALFCNSSEGPPQWSTFYKPKTNH